jgi:hypothetical protein
MADHRRTRPSLSSAFHSVQSVIGVARGLLIEELAFDKWIGDDALVDHRDEPNEQIGKNIGPCPQVQVADANLFLEPMDSSSLYNQGPTL